MVYKDEPVKAKIKILTQQEYSQGAGQISMEGTVYTVQLNPSSINITDGVHYDKKSTVFKELEGRRAPLSQYTTHNARELSVQLLFDTYTSELSETEKKDVKKEYIDEFLKLIANKEGKPPLVFFSWGSIQFKGVVTKMNYTYTMFTREGKPVRASMNLTLTEYFFE